MRLLVLILFLLIFALALGAIFLPDNFSIDKFIRKFDKGIVKIERELAT